MYICRYYRKWKIKNKVRCKLKVEQLYAEYKRCKTKKQKDDLIKSFVNKNL